MHSLLDDAKRDLLSEAAGLSGRTGSETDADNELVSHLLGLYYLHVPAEELVERKATDVYGAAMSHYRYAAQRPQGTASVRVFTPSVEQNDWAADGHTVIEIVTDDMPFLVDSVTMALTAQGLPIHVVIHPQLLVRRDVTGQLLEICDGEDDAAHVTSELVRESWMHIEVDREADQQGLDEVSGRLTQILRDVREVVEDWKKMHEQALRIVSDLQTSPPPLPEAEITEGEALLSIMYKKRSTVSLSSRRRPAISGRSSRRSSYRRSRTCGAPGRERTPAISTTNTCYPRQASSHRGESCFRACSPAPGVRRTFRREPLALRTMWSSFSTRPRGGPTTS